MLAKDVVHLGLAAIRFDGKSQYMTGAKGLGGDMPGPFTLVVVTTLNDGWPKGIFSVAPASRGADFVSPSGFALTFTHGAQGAFALSQGYQSIHLNLTIDNEQGKPQTLTIVRPARRGEWVRGYRNGELKARELVCDTEQGRRQDTGYMLCSRWPLRGDLFGACDLYEILVFDRVLSDVELQSLHRYLFAPRTN